MEQEENEESGRVKFLSEQLDQMDQNWSELQAMSDRREKLLKDELKELQFNNDCALVEQILANHEVQLKSVQFCDDPVAAEEALQQHRDIMNELQTTNERVSLVLRTF